MGRDLEETAKSIDCCLLEITQVKRLPLRDHKNHFFSLPSAIQQVVLSFSIPLCPVDVCRR